MLKIENLSKSYGEKLAVNNVSLEISEGEIFAFIGHNGAGKTTTIKCAVGILSFDEGRVTLNGINLLDNPLEFKKMVAYIPDNPDLYNALTGIQYLEFVSEVYKIDKSERIENIKYYSDMFELTQSLGNLISSYSHGMKQKLAVISAFIRKPKLLILDEPFVGLDPKASFKVKEIMKEMCKAGSMVFFSTHVLEVAEKLCDKVAIIKNGQIIISGTMDEVKGASSLEEVFLETVDE